MSDAVLIGMISAVLNGAVVWGVMRTELRWLRRDVDRANGWIDDFQKEDRRAHHGN